jgi:Tol biopolymer transport system component
LFIPQPLWGIEKLAFLREGNVWIANIDGTNPKQLTNSGKDRNPTVSPDGTLVAFTRGSVLKIKYGYGTEEERIRYGQVYLVPTQGGAARLFQVKGVQMSVEPSFSSDGENLILVGLANPQVKDEEHGGKRWHQAFADMSVVIAQVKTGDSRKVVSKPKAFLGFSFYYSRPSFSPDGKKIVYQEIGSDVSGGFVVTDLQGKVLFRFPSDEHEWRSKAYWTPSFSPDGKKILCYSPRPGNGPIYLVDLATGIPEKITEEDGADPRFVDQGQAIVFARWQGRWSDSPPGNQDPKCDIWRLELKPGAVPQKILSQAAF